MAVAGRRTSAGGSSGPSSSELADIIRNLQTAAELMQTTARDSNTTAQRMAASFKENDGMMNNLVASLATAMDPNAVYGPGYGPSIGQRSGSGPAGGRPTVGDNQSRRPNHYYDRQYPGAAPAGGPRGAPSLGVPSHHGGTGGWGGMRRAAANAVHDRYGAASGETFRVANTDAQGNATHYHAYDQGGNYIRTFEAGERGIPGRVAAAGRRAGISDMAGGFASRGVLGAVGQSGMMGAAVAAPIVGAEALYGVGTFIGSQRAANAKYQSIYGGSNFEGMTERAHQEGFKLRQTFGNVFGGGGLTGADADRAFQGVSGMGFRGADRNRGLGFITSNYKSMGMSVDESLQLVGINAKTAATNFTELHGQLKAVSDMARQVGQNADTMRQSFIASYGTAVNAGLGGSSGVIGIANTAGTLGMGRQYAGINTSAMNGTMGNLQMQASQAGYSNVVAYTSAVNANPMVGVQTQQNMLNSRFNSTMGTDAKALVQAAIARHGGGAAVQNDPSAALSIVDEIMSKKENQNVFNSWSILAAMQSAGVTVDQATANNPRALAAYYVQWLASKGTNLTMPAAAAMKAQDQSTTKGISATDLFGGGGPGKSIDTKTGTTTTDPVINDLAKGIGKNGLVKVQTASGPQVVSLDTAAKNYRDQLVNGTAIIMTGNDTGSTVGQKYGKETGAHYASTAATKAQGSVFGKDTAAIMALGLSDASLSHLADLGKVPGVTSKTLLGLAKQQAAAGPSGGVGVTISMQPELAKYLKITTTGNATVESGATSNSPPTVNIPGSGH